MLSNPLWCSPQSMSVSIVTSECVSLSLPLRPWALPAVDWGGGQSEYTSWPPLQRSTLGNILPAWGVRGGETSRTGLVLFLSIHLVLCPQAEHELRVAQTEFDRQAEVTRLLLEGISSTHVSLAGAHTTQSKELCCFKRLKNHERKLTPPNQ